MLSTTTKVNNSDPQCGIFIPSDLPNLSYSYSTPILRASLFSNVPDQFKGSRLKADAPEFVPTQFVAISTDSLTKQTATEMNVASTSTDSPTKQSTREAAKAQRQIEKDERKAASLAKKAGKKAAKQLDGAADGRLLLATDLHPY